MTWPTTSQSKSMRMAARCCLTEGLAWLVGLLEQLDIGGDVDRLDVFEARTPLASHQRRNWATALGVGAPGVRVADVGGEEFGEAGGGVVAEVGDDRRDGKHMELRLGDEIEGHAAGSLPLNSGCCDRSLARASCEIEVAMKPQDRHTEQ